MALINRVRFLKIEISKRIEKMVFKHLHVSFPAVPIEVSLSSLTREQSKALDDRTWNENKKKTVFGCPF